MAYSSPWWKPINGNERGRIREGKERGLSAYFVQRPPSS